MKEDRTYPSMAYMPTTTNYIFLKRLWWSGNRIRESPLDTEDDLKPVSTETWVSEKPSVLNHPKFINNIDYLTNVLLLLGYVEHYKATHPENSFLSEISRDKILNSIYRPTAVVEALKEAALADNDCYEEEIQVDKDDEKQEIWDSERRAQDMFEKMCVIV